MDNGELGGSELTGRITEIRLCCSFCKQRLWHLTHSHIHLDSDHSLEQTKNRYASSWRLLRVLWQKQRAVSVAESRLIEPPSLQCVAPWCLHVNHRWLWHEPSDSYTFTEQHSWQVGHSHVCMCVSVSVCVREGGTVTHHQGPSDSYRTSNSSGSAE